MKKEGCFVSNYDSMKKDYLVNMGAYNTSKISKDFFDKLTDEEKNHCTVETENQYEYKKAVEMTDEEFEKFLALTNAMHNHKTAKNTNIIKIILLVFAGLTVLSAIIYIALITNALSSFSF